MPLPGAVVGVVAGLVFGEAAGTATASPVLTLVVALLGSGLVTAVVSTFLRKRSGEGPAAAARDLADGVGRLVDASESLTLPLQQRVVQLSSELAAMTSKYAAAREGEAAAQIALAEAHADNLRDAARRASEAHEMRNELAAKAAMLEARTLELENLRVQLGHHPGRRADDG